MKGIGANRRMEEGQAVNQRLKKAMSLAFISGYQLDGNAFALLKTLAQDQEFEGFMEKILDGLKSLPEKPLFITREMIEKTMTNVSQEAKEEEVVEIVEGVGEGFEPLSREFPSELEVLADPTETISSMGSLNDFLKYFQDRFMRIEKLLREHLDVKNTVSIKEALNSSPNAKVKIIGMVTGIRERQGRIFIQIEDLEAVATVLISPRAERTIHEKARRLFLDQVICVDGIKTSSDLITAINLIDPDIPERKPKTAEREVYAALLSDLHVGSKKFQSDAFNKFLRWLRGQEGNNRQREIASRVKYIIIAGDLVDGIGIYPNQEEELAIKDIYEQYALAAKLIQQIPEYLEVIIIPGNHDAARQALPQPAMMRKYAEPVYEARKVAMLGNPAKLRLSGVEFLVYHGTSLNDVIGSVPDVTYRDLDKTISKAMRYLLKTRHLAPTYGGKTPIAPEMHDFLVIDSIPDVFHAGHVHVFGYETYRGTLIVNSGSWQSQTAYQEKMDLTPTWGVAPILNLKTLQLEPINFAS